VLREPGEHWPAAALDLIERIIDNGDLPLTPPPGHQDLVTERIRFPPQEHAG